MRGETQPCLYFIIHDNNDNYYYSFTISDWCVEYQVLKLTDNVTDIEVWKYTGSRLA